MTHNRHVLYLSVCGDLHYRQITFEGPKAGTHEYEHDFSRDYTAEEIRDFRDAYTRYYTNVNFCLRSKADFLGFPPRCLPMEVRMKLRPREIDRRHIKTLALMPETLFELSY